MMNDFIRRARILAQAQVPHSAGGCPFSECNGVGYCGLSFLSIEGPLEADDS